MSIKENYKKVLENIDKACNRVNRKSSEIRILAVCKSQPVARIIEAYECGMRLFGENKITEAENHLVQIKYPDIEWHFIGKLQKNKINKILKSFNFIQSVDGVKSLEHIHKRINQCAEVFIEINIGEEKNKSGFTVDGLKKALVYISQLNRVKITGLMSIPPLSSDPEGSRTFFSQLHQLKNEINDMKLPNFIIKHLSMGMSNDYEVAIEEGATIIRIGTAIFGRRIG